VLLLAWVFLSTFLFFLGVAFFGHDFHPPAYVDWGGFVGIMLGIGLFGYFFRVMLPDHINSSNSRDE
jgi:drug/metabolite transporter (DMT)-like permease